MFKFFKSQWIFSQPRNERRYFFKDYQVSRGMAQTLTSDGFPVRLVSSADWFFDLWRENNEV